MLKADSINGKTPLLLITKIKYHNSVNIISLLTKQTLQK